VRFQFTSVFLNWGAGNNYHKGLRDCFLLVNAAVLRGHKEVLNPEVFLNSSTFNSCIAHTLDVHISLVS
jgi:hypothetical protein